MLRPILKQWLDDHLPSIVDEHVKREIHRITGRPALGSSRRLLIVKRQAVTPAAMIKRIALAASVAAAALASTPAIARPMTATDMHMMRRLGSHSVSPDGRYAVFTLSTTDLAANKRNNVVHILDLKAKGAAPQPLAGSTQGAHDAVFGADGAIWYLAPVSGQDQLFRMTVGGQPAQLSQLQGRYFRLQGQRRRQPAACSGPIATCAAPTSPATACPKAEKTGSGRVYDQLFVRHWDTWAEPGVRSRIFAFPIEGGQVTGAGVPVTGALVGDTPSKPFGGGEEIDISADGRTVYFALREAGRIEATSTNLDIFAAPADGSAQPTNLTADNDGTDNLPTLSPDGRSLAYFSMARAGYEADRQVLHGPRSRHAARSARSPPTGTARSVRSPGRRTASRSSSTPGHAGRRRCSASMSRAAR